MMNIKSVLKILRFYPPYLGAGVKVSEVNDDTTRIAVEMKLAAWNRNFVGTQFGGSLYSMVDPFYMFILMENLGNEYIVWDKAASIQFKKPGRGKVKAVCEISREKIAEIKKLADEQDKVEPTFQVEIVDDAGLVIAIVDKLLYVKRKDKVKPKS